MLNRFGLYINIVVLVIAFLIVISFRFWQIRARLMTQRHKEMKTDIIRKRSSLTMKWVRGFLGALKLDQILTFHCSRPVLPVWTYAKNDDKRTHRGLENLSFTLVDRKPEPTRQQTSTVLTAVKILRGFSNLRIQH